MNSTSILDASDTHGFAVHCGTTLLQTQITTCGCQYEPEVCQSHGYRNAVMLRAYATFI